MSNHIKTLQATFNLPLRTNEISRWRGAFVEMAGRDHTLLHNHKNGESHSYHYRYPLIQYRVSNRKAHIYALNEGIENFHNIIAESDWNIRWKNKRRPLQLQEMVVDKHTVTTTPQMNHYQLLNYLPFNQENFARWDTADNLIDRIKLLDRIIAGNIITIANLCGYRLPVWLNVDILNIISTKTISVHGIPRLAFDLTFKANIDLPMKIALGRAVSHGFGICMPTKSR